MNNYTTQGKTKLYTTIFLSIILFTSQLFGQDNISVLKKTIAETNNDSIRSDSYEQLYKHYKNIDPDTAIHYLKEGREYFTIHNYDKGLANMLSWLAISYSAQGMHDIASKSAEEALGIYTALNSQRGIAITNNLLGVIDGRLSNLTSATNHFYTALKIFETIKDTDGISNTYLKLGLVNDISKNYVVALDFYNKGIYLAKIINRSKSLSDLYNNKGTIYAKLNNLDSALVYFQQALNLCEQDSVHTECLLSLNNMGNIMEAKYHDNVKAMNYFNRALEIAIRSKQHGEHARILINIASIYINTDNAKAVILLEEALKTAKSVRNIPIQTEAINGLLEIYKDEKKYEEVIKLMEEEKNLNDTVFTINKSRALANLSEVYERDKLKSQIQTLEESKKDLKTRKNYFLGALLLSSGILIFVIFLYRKTRKLNKLLTTHEHELEELNIDRNKLFSIIGHDLKGPIGNLTSLIAICRNEFLPQEQLHKILEMMESSANASYRTLNNLLNWGKTQLVGESYTPVQIMVNKIINNEISLLKISIENKSLTILNSIPAGTEIFADTNETEFIFRNLLSNAVKYSNRFGIIEISQLEANRPNRVTFTIKDYGCGIDKDRITKIFDQFVSSKVGSENEKGTGIGLKLCKEFIVKNQGDIWVESEVNIGTTFYLTLNTQASKT